jgi:8-oxo-dGTP diphosphatase
MAEIIQRVAAKAVIVNDGNVLVLRESGKYEEGTNVGKYDLPGGRINLGESVFDALKREVKEECGIEVEIGQPIYVGEWSPEIKGVINQIVAIFFRCQPKSLDIKISDDHDDLQWIGSAELEQIKLTSPSKEVIAAALDAN